MKRAIPAISNSGPQKTPPVGTLDRYHREFPETTLSCVYPLAAPGFGVEVKNVWTTNRQSPGPRGPPPRPDPSFKWLEMLEKHSRDHRTGVACPTCYARAGVPLDESIEEVDEVEEVAQIYSLMELTPKITSSEKELLLHFERSTSQNLALGTTIWRTAVLRNALQVCVLLLQITCSANAHSVISSRTLFFSLQQLIKTIISAQIVIATKFICNTRPVLCQVCAMP